MSLINGSVNILFRVINWVHPPWADQLIEDTIMAQAKDNMLLHMGFSMVSKEERPEMIPSFVEGFIAGIKESRCIPAFMLPRAEAAANRAMEKFIQF